MLQPILCLLLSLADAISPQPKAAEIMKRVAENQDREQKARGEYVYEERIHQAMRARGGKLLQEQTKRFRVLPQASGTKKELQSRRGRYWRKGQYHEYTSEDAPEGGLFNIIIEDDGDAGGRDGLNDNLFPLTSSEQDKYSFELLESKKVEGRPTYRIRFRPTDPHDFGWAGEALIDAEEFQPVSVYTRLSRRIPAAVRIMLGTDVPGLGFTIRYSRVDKDIWFPTSYGTEFGVDALFFIHRTFSESIENTGFQRANVESQVHFDAPGAPQ